MHLGVLELLREVAGHRQLLQALGLQLGDRGQPLVLVHGVAGDEEAQQIAHALVVGHVVEPGGLQPALHLAVGVGVEVGQQVAAGRDVAALPGIAVAVDRPGAGARDDGVLHVGAADHRRHHRVGVDRGLQVGVRVLLQQLRDHDRQHLDVAELLGADAEEQVAPLAGDVGVPGLEPVLHRDGDLAVLPAQHLLQLAGVDGVRLVGLRLELQLLLVEEHPCSWLGWGWAGAHADRRGPGTRCGRSGFVRPGRLDAPVWPTRC